MMEKPKNQGQNTDIDDNTRHIEVSEYPIKNRSKAAVFFENVLHAMADTARAIDDSYGIVSAIVASIGIFIIMLPMLICTGILSIAYFIHSRYKREQNSPYINKVKLNNSCEKIITADHFALWEKKLATGNTTLTFSNAAKTTISITEYVHQHKPDQIFSLTKEHVKQITDLESKFNEYVSAITDEDLKKRLQAYKQRVDLIKQLLVQRKASAVSKIKNSALKRKMSNDLALQQDNKTTKKNFLYYLKRFGIWARDNYKKLLTGATIAATLASLLVLMAGSALLTMFPLNLIIAVGLVIIVATCNYFYKHFFKHRLQKMTTSVNTVKHSVHDKRPIMNLLVDCVLIKDQMQKAINGYQNEHEKLLQTKVKDRPKIPNALNDEDQAHFKQEQKIEHIEIKTLKNKPHKARFVMNYIMPSLMALNAGYSIGATLLQLSLMSGLIVPIMPFIILGLCFGGIYVIHRLYRSYNENRTDMKSINKLNNSVITPSKLRLWNNKLRLLNEHGLKYSQSMVSAQAFVKQHTAEDIVELIQVVFDELKVLRTRNNNKQQIHKIVQNLTNVFNAQRAILKSTDRQQLLIEKLNLDEPQQHSERYIQLKKKLQAKQIGKKIYGVIAHYFKPLAQGMAFGLSAAASLIIFMVGASTLASIPMAIGLLVIGAVVGVSISIVNKILSNKRVKFTKDRKVTKNALKDKEVVMDMYLEAKQALFDARVLVTGKNPIEQRVEKLRLKSQPKIVDDFDVAPSQTSTPKSTRNSEESQPLVKHRSRRARKSTTSVATDDLTANTLQQSLAI